MSVTLSSFCFLLNVNKRFENTLGHVILVIFTLDSESTYQFTNRIGNLEDCEVLLILVCYRKFKLIGSDKFWWI